MLGRIEGDQAPVIHDADAAAEAVGFFEVVGGEEDGGAVGCHVSDEGPDVAAGLDVEAEGGFVEEEEAGSGERADGEVEAAFHAAGVGLHEAVGGRREAGPR